MLDKLQWRYAVKQYDPSQPVSEDKLDQILEAIRYAPTSSGLQPFKVFVITDQDLKSKIRPIAMDQPQIEDASHLLVFAAFDNYDDARIDAVVDQHAEERPGTRENLETYYNMLKSVYLPREARVNFEHAARQAYIAFGFAMAAAAELEVDTTPMEGFDPAALDELLGLEEQGLKSVNILTIGTRAAEGDWLQPMKKVRKPDNVLFEHLG